MKTSIFFLSLSGVLLAGGCASDSGGTADETYSTTGAMYHNHAADMRELHTAPPTMRPGMDRNDPRDPNALNAQRTTP